MSDDLIKLARELLFKTTPGPWSVVSSLPVYAVSAPGKNHPLDVVTASGREYARGADMYKHGSRQSDADFIAFARNNLPAILDMVERQQKALEFYADAGEYSHDRLCEHAYKAKAVLEGRDE